MNNQTSIRVSSSSETARYVQEIRGRLEEDIIVVAVEGSDDSRIFKKLLKRNVAVIPTNGVGMLLSIDKALYDWFPRNFISIKDADFDHLNKRPPIHENVFVTDKHDMEMTMIDEEIIDSIIIENIGDKEDFINYDAKEVVIRLLENLKYYSYIKWFNNVFDCGITFDVINVIPLGVADNLLSVDIALSLLFDNEVNKSDRVKRVTEAEIYDFMDSHICEDLTLLICGHDFCCALLDWIRKKTGHNLKRSGLESQIRLQYQPHKFKNTALYQSIHKWEIKNNRTIVA